MNLIADEDYTIVKSPLSHHNFQTINSCSTNHVVYIYTDIIVETCFNIIEEPIWVYDCL